MKIRLLFSALAGVAVWLILWRQPFQSIYLPCAAAGFFMGMLIPHRPHRAYVRDAGTLAAMFALVFGLMVEVLDRDPNASVGGGLLVFCVLSLLSSSPGLIAAFLAKEIAAHVRDALR